VQRGAYVLADAPNAQPGVVLLASGSEVAIALEARDVLARDGIPARVVSVPSHELFWRQPAEYRVSVLPTGVRKVAIEAAHPMSWYRWTGEDGAVVGIETFGASAPFQKLYEEYGITAARLVETVKSTLAR
jgi:transketolase